MKNQYFLCVSSAKAVNESVHIDSHHMKTLVGLWSEKLGICRILRICHVIYHRPYTATRNLELYESCMPIYGHATKMAKVAKMDEKLRL